jgi:RNA polymerase sigma-70 factor, ECF subfamily
MWWAVCLVPETEYSPRRGTRRLGAACFAKGVTLADSRSLLSHEGNLNPALPPETPPCADQETGQEAGEHYERETALIQAECVDYRSANLSAGWAVPSAEPTQEVLGLSFTGIVDRWQGPLISFLYGMVGSREQAEDLAQDTLIKAYEAMERRREGQQFSVGWLFRIARNTAIDAMRRKRLISWLPFGVEHEQIMPTRGDFAGQLAEREMCRQVLAQMPPRYRECLLLRTVAGMSNVDIAHALGLSARNVNTILFRARERFREIYAAIDRQSTDTSKEPNEPLQSGKDARR